MDSSITSFDCLIVGGGVAGLAAALGLGRARRTTLLCSVGAPRNAPAEHSHNFLTRDGTPPLELLAIARRQLEPYESVILQEVKVEQVTRRQDGVFSARLSNGREVSARTVILATGMRDDLDVLPGLAPLWGHSVFACPFCHGWEYRERPWAVLVTQPAGFAMVKMARSWTKALLVCGDGNFVPDDHQKSRLEELGIPFVSSPVVGLEGEGGELRAIRFADGSRLSREALLYRPPNRQRSPIAESLGCVIDSAGYVQTSPPFGQTEVPGVFAVGDMTSPMHSLAWASAGGTLAAGGVQHLLAERDFEGA